MNTPQEASPALNSNGDADKIRSALGYASINALRIALYHQTRDPELAAMPVKEHPVRGGALSTFVVPRSFHDQIREKALAYLLSGARARPVPTREEAAELMALFSGRRPTTAEVNYGYEELAFEEYPRNAVWQTTPPKSRLNDFAVTIVGSGFSGLAAAVQLERLGIRYQIIERLPSLGGTWHINDYPEARVDVPTFAYQYKFEKDYPWQSFFAPQKELLAYANHIADKYHIKPNIRFATRLTNAIWNSASKRWEIELEGSDGVRTKDHTNVIISASGLFSTPKLPAIPGIEDFRGTMFHTTDWDHAFDYRGKKIAVIGTGSTGTQLAREMGLAAGKLTVFQRTANWVTPIAGYHDKVPEEVKWLFNNMPGYRSWFVYTNYYAELATQDLHDLDPDWIADGGRVNPKNQQLRESLTEFIRSKVSHKKGLFEKLVPTHSPLSRRLVIDNSWYETLVRDNVEVVTEGIKRITANSIIDNNGNEHEVDLIVLSAGFRVSQYLWPAEYRGREGQSLEALWASDGARAFKGLTVPGFPNFFMMYGPNAQCRAGSFHSIVECLARYIGNLLVHMLEEDKSSIEVRESAYLRYNSDLDAAMKKLLWEDEQGGGGYYVNEHGRAGVIMPWRLHDFYQMIEYADTNNYRFS